MIKRDQLNELKTLLTEYPVVTVLGPRQSGKTTLVRHILKGYEYANLEIPETREFANTDPKAFLKQFKGKFILDEIQRVPELLSYIQAHVDNEGENGQVILTGSHQLQLHQAVTQSLAGRTAILNLLPLAIHELTGAKIRFNNWGEYAYHGFLPRIHDQQQRPTQAYSNYFQTYVERDVRQLINLKDVSLFEKFMKLLAGRSGQLINHASLSNEVGVDTKTIQNWLSILEASFVIFKLPPYYESFNKRLVKSPKYYFVDTGLLCFLLDIEKPEQVMRDPLSGFIFENMVVLDCVKTLNNQGRKAELYFYRDNNGIEVDLLYKHEGQLNAVEIKSSSTFTKEFMKNLDKFQSFSGSNGQRHVVYSGSSRKISENTSLVAFDKVNKLFH